MHVKTLIEAQWVIPVEPQDTILENHSIAIDDGRIVNILPTEKAHQKYTADEVIELPGQALIPGLINSHTHSPMSLFRGLADDLPLMTWLTEHIWPAEQKWVHEEFIADGTRLAVAEMLRSGTTCFNDMYFFPDVTGRVAAQAGIRAIIGLIVIDFPSAWADDTDDYFDKALQTHDHFKAHPLIATAFAPHAPYSVSDAPLSRIEKLAVELDLPIHIHVHETADEINQGFDSHGKRPIQRLDELGLLSPNLMAVHMTQLETDEIERIKNTGVHVVHCPQSNMKLASGFCPVQTLLEKGINVALGTDGAASNNDLDMLAEMQSAAMLAKAVSGNAAALPATQALQMATINGAKALGIDQETGSLSKGKSADICAIDLSTLETQPIYNPVSQIVYACGREQVSNVWVAGEHLLKDRVLTSMDMQEILEKAQQWRDKIANPS